MSSLFCDSLNTESLLSVDTLETIVQSFADNINRIWHKHSKIINITKYSKAWWNNNCCRNLNIYRQSRWLKDWKSSKKQLRRQNKTSWMEKLTRSPIKSVVLGNSWTRSKREIFWLPKPYNTMVDPVSNWMIYGKLFTNPSILLEIIKSISAYWKKSLIKQQ